MPAEIVDLFCGVGGLTRGLQNAGLNVLTGFDIDQTCQFAYEENNNVPYQLRDIRGISANEINDIYTDNAIKIMVGCAPCQPFSQMRFKQGNEYNYEQDEKHDLLLEYGRLISEVMPTIVSMENVPKIKDTYVYEEFLEILVNMGYHVTARVVHCQDYGVSQNRRRFILLASLLGDIDLIQPTHDVNHRVTVRDVIGDLPQVACNEIDPIDPMHRTALLSSKNIERIQASLPGGTWKDWPYDLRCPCHQKETGQTYSSVYGRMSWDRVEIGRASCRERV